MRKRDALEAAGVLAGATLFAVLVAAPGIPALRHDWAWIVDRSGYIQTALDTIGGWQPLGIGAPRPYPSDYLVAVVNIVIAWLFGTRVAFIANVAVVALACSFAGLRLTRAVSGAPFAGVAGAIFAAFNPWVYTKLIAGHLSMLLAYAALGFILAEAVGGRPRPNRVALFFVIASLQLQFFVLAAPVVALVSMRTRNMWPILCGFVAASPSIAGILLNLTALSTTPYNASWQLFQSIPPLAASALSGYFTGYADKLGPFATIPVWIVAALSLLGAMSAKRRRLGICAIAAALLVIGVVSGERGPVAAYYQAAVLAVPATALFRELYDMLGCLALIYVIGSALLTKRWPLLAIVQLVVVVFLPIGWLGHSPWRFWVDARTLAPISITAPANTRFASLPGFQPLSLGWAGAGLDPDAYDRADNVTPLNTALEEYPMNVALRDAQVVNSTRLLSALSVAELVRRPLLRSNNGVLGAQLAFDVPQIDRERPSLSYQFLSPLPELSLVAREPAVTVPGSPGEGRIFFADAPGGALAGVVPTPDRSHLKASDGWVDVRLAFLSHPDLAQGLGGVVTSSQVLLPIGGESGALVFVLGQLQTQNSRLLSKTTTRYEWVPLPHGTNAVRCIGLCAIAMLGSVPAGRATGGTAPLLAALDFSAPLPWIIHARMPRVPAGALLRYNVRFDPHWIALAGGMILTHVRIDTTVNGWDVPGGKTARTLTLIETGAAIQAFCEVAGTLASLVAFIMLAGEEMARMRRNRGWRDRPRTARVFSSQP